jgi:sugar/nucleoside kinase (ribokinase family)
MAKKFDVYAFGMVCPSRLLILKDPWPRPDGYAEIRTSYDTIGGEAANCAIVMARLGVTVKLDGNWLPANDAGRSALLLLKNQHVDTARITQKESQGPEELLVGAGSSRTIFARYGALLSGRRRWNNPLLADINLACVACIDPFFKQSSKTASEQAIRAGVPYTTVDGFPDDPVIEKAAIVIISEEFRQRLRGGGRQESWIRRYQQRCRGLIVFTDGPRPVLYVRPQGPIRRHKPPAIKAIDTSGAGDTFRAGMTYGLLMGWDDDRAVRFSTALASLNCLRFPGVLDSPTIAEVQAFLNRGPTNNNEGLLKRRKQ